MKKLLFLLLTVSLLLGACKKKYAPYQLRIQNTTAIQLSDVVVVSGNRINHYGTVTPNQLTGYLESIDNNYSELRIVISGNVYTYNLLATGAYAASPAAALPAATCVITQISQGQYQIAFQQ
jgi:hypothetical protein